MDNLAKKLSLLKKKAKEDIKNEGTEYISYQNIIENKIKEEDKGKLLNKKRLKSFDDNSDDYNNNNNEKNNSNKKHSKNNSNEKINSNKEINFDENDENSNNENNSQVENNIDDNNNKSNESSESENIKENSESKDINDLNINKENIEHKITINPKEIIKLTKVDDTKKRTIDSSQYSNEYKSNELYNWFYLIFDEWEKYIKENLQKKNSSALEISKDLEKYQLCFQNIKPLLSNLKTQKVTQVILDKLFQIMVFAEDKDFIRAHDSYIELSIGNAPWPMGVTMVGIHERSGRSRISTSQVAYILNDEVTKKYLQSVKRVLSFLQKRYPKVPSELVL